MKRPSSSDSVGGLITEKSLGELNNNSSSVYSRGFQSMLDGLDDEDGMEESGHVSEKKRRLSVDQVKALEKNFEVENKLEPDRKMKLAQELGLQPRQVAVWFQNRRARWKTKQLERDYGVLKANYDTLKLDFESLKQEKEGLLAEVKELKSKLQEDDENTDTGGGGGGGEGHEEMYIKEEIQVTDEPIMFSSEQREIPAIQSNGAGVFGDFKDGSSDSDSSAILNDENTNNNSSPNASSGVLNQHMTHMSPASGSASSPLGFNCSSSSSPPSTNGFQFSTIAANAAQKGGAYHQNQHFGRMEEHNFFGTDETCNFFAEDQAPSLQWYYSTEQWN